MMLINRAEAHTLWRKTKKALLVGSKEFGLEVNADTTKYMVMSRDQNARRSQKYEDW